MYPIDAVKTENKNFFRTPLDGPRATDSSFTKCREPEAYFLSLNWWLLRILANNMFKITTKPSLFQNKFSPGIIQEYYKAKDWLKACAAQLYNTPTVETYTSTHKLCDSLPDVEFID